MYIEFISMNLLASCSARTTPYVHFYLNSKFSESCRFLFLMIIVQLHKYKERNISIP